MNKHLGLVCVSGGGEGVGGTYFIKVCILTGNEKDNSIPDIPGDIPDMRTDSINLTILSHQCCLLVILKEEIFSKEKGN